MLGVLVPNNSSERRTKRGSPTSSDGGYRHPREQRAARGSHHETPNARAQIEGRTDTCGFREANTLWGHIGGPRHIGIVLQISCGPVAMTKLVFDGLFAAEHAQVCSIETATQHLINCCLEQLRIKVESDRFLGGGVMPLPCHE